MQLDPEVCYRALRTRDSRFDGRFFTAVRSTGIYCRPICPAPTPRRENCLFLACAAAAQEAGFRPCLRCRPEASPGTPAWQGTSATVSRALRLIAEGALDSGRVSELALRLGVGERHLRRLFVEHLGATPQAVAHTRRVLFAKKLLDETQLPISQVAFAAGFGSVRRFNSAMREAYARAPQALRQARRSGPVTDAPGSGSVIELKLAYRPPFDWEALVRFLAPRAIPGVETVSAAAYRHSFVLDGARGIAEVRPAARGHQLLARIRTEGAAPLLGLVERLRRVFDLAADPDPIAAQLRRDPRLARRLAQRPCLRVPGAWDGFELAVRAILGQQVSVAAATRLAGRLVRAYGEPLRLGSEDAGLAYAFPTPEALMHADPRRLGLPRARAAAIAELARAVAKDHLHLDGCADLASAVRELSALPGIGPWTAQVVAMRALREPDAFPSGDLGLRRALADSARPLSPARLEALAEAWRPWRAYAAMLLWSVPR